MGFKQLNLDSIVTEIEASVIKSLNIKIEYADKTSKVSQFSIGDQIAIKYVQDGKLLAVIGTVIKINTDTDVYFIMDTSKISESYTIKVFPSQLRDLSNLTAPSFDKSYDENGDEVIPSTNPTNPTEPSAGGEETTTIS